MSTPAPAPVPAPLRESAGRITTRALGWLRRHCELGSLPPGTTAEIAHPDSIYKPLGETALAASLVLRERVAPDRELRIARELLDFAWWELRGGDVFYERQLRHMMMTDPLELYTHFVRTGYRHERLDSLLAHLAGLIPVSAVEHVPNRRLAVANASRLAGIDRDVDWERLLDDTWLWHTPEPWVIDWMTGYSVTHTVFHATDWGARSEELPRRVEDYLQLWLPVWLDVWREIQEWDLVTELLIVGSCLRKPYRDPALWEELASVQHEDGLLPRDGREVSGDAAQRFRDHHHPTVAAAVAGTLALSRAAGR